MTVLVLGTLILYRLSLLDWHAPSGGARGCRVMSENVSTADDQSNCSLSCEVVVVNKNRSRFDLAIDRHFGSGMDEQPVGEPGCLGNPFVMGDDGSREDVVAKFARYFIERWQDDAELRNFVAEYVEEHDELRLGCHCAPKLCHGEVIKSVIECAILGGGA